MLPTFEYATACYLDDWLYHDSRLVEKLGNHDLCFRPIPLKTIRDTLIEAAKYYGVIRGFALERDGENDACRVCLKG